MRNRNTRLRHTALGGLAALLLMAGWTGGAAAADPGPPFRMGLPIHCEPGKTCWIVNYVDHDPTEGIRDYMCGGATYNGADGHAHNGTDFAIRDGRALRAGVPVVAAADGIVKATRDGMPDADIRDGKRPHVPDGKYCGNGVVIEHGNGWSTQYCHLRRDSVAVRPRQRIRTGQPIGLVGLSGFTQFPHLHITVRHDGAVVDPFIGLHRATPCGHGKTPLWTDAVLAELPYVPTAIYNAGFAGEKPSLGKVHNGDYDGNTIERQAPALVLWAELFNVRIGDRVALRIQLPDGRTLIEHTDVIKKNQARWFLYAGRPLKKPHAWPPGTYTGAVRIKQADGATSTRNATVTLR